MEIFLNLIVGICVSLFWAALLSFIPTTLYLLMINPQMYESRAAREIGIFVLNDEENQSRCYKTQMVVVTAIFIVCFLIVGVMCVFNAFKYGSPGIAPFDILSTAMIVFFALAIVFYIPVIIYVSLRNPWRYNYSGICLNGIYISYGICLLIFSAIFSLYWIKAHDSFLKVSNIIPTLAFTFISSAALAYLPILTCIYLREAKNHRLRKIGHPNILFIIFVVCFLISTGVYCYELSVEHGRAAVIDTKI